MRNRIIIILLLGLLFSFITTFFQQNVILSGKPLQTENKALRKSGMQHYYTLKGQRGKEDLVLWLRYISEAGELLYRNRIDSSDLFYAFGPYKNPIDFKHLNNDLGHIPFDLTYCPCPSVS